MTIGEVAKRSGLRASAIRFYEKTGILPKPLRAAGQRRYDGAVLEKLAVIERAKNCGFTLDEVVLLFNGGVASELWRALAEKKLAELEAAAERIRGMRALLEKRCQCADIAECGRRILGSRSGGEKRKRVSS